MSYQGADYSAEPLAKSEKMIKQMVRQFPQKAADQKKQIEDAYKEVRYRRAEKEYLNATYRYNKREALASRIHCTRVLAEFGDTPFADQAKEMMEKTGGMPSEPIQQFSWLADLFSTRDKVQPLLKPLPARDDKEVLRDTYERTAARNDAKPAIASSPTEVDGVIRR